MPHTRVQQRARRIKRAEQGHGARARRSWRPRLPPPRVARHRALECCECRQEDETTLVRRVPWALIAGGVRLLAARRRLGAACVRAGAGADAWAGVHERVSAHVCACGAWVFARDICRPGAHASSCMCAQCCVGCGSVAHGPCVHLLYMCNVCACVAGHKTRQLDHVSVGMACGCSSCHS